MNSLNSILIEGTVVEDPKTETLPSGSLRCDFVIVSDRHFKQGDTLEKEVSRFDVEAWSKLGEHCSAQLRQGRACRVVGRLKQYRRIDADG
ncbi:MAG: single-stranded DNA-binding protein, partial [Vicinamibacterales bacterium]